MRQSKGSPEREDHSNTGNISNKQPNPTSTRTGRTTTKAQSEQKEGNKQDQSRIK